MRRLLALSILALLLPFSTGASVADDFSLNISLTRGERSRDSHSQTTRITLKGRELVYEKSYSGFRGGARSQPVRKSFRISDEEVEGLKKIVRDNDLLTSDRLEVSSEAGGIRRYFELALNINLNGKKSSIEINGSRTAVEIKEKPAYRKAYALLDAVYKILSAQDKEIGYENRDLVIDKQ
ncbi:MAG: hypothetical protein ICV60_19805 [Pyrinomonadaceae bacterium]|nr:hypothetical protein [Pyrinomonadaceae bacterium]